MRRDAEESSFRTKGLEQSLPSCKYSVIALALLATLVLSVPIHVGSTINALATSVPASTIELGTVPKGLAIDSGTGTLYTVLYLNGTLLALNSNTLHTIGRVVVPSPYDVAVDPATHLIYVSQGGSNASITIINGTTQNYLVGEIKGAGTPYALAIDPSRNLVFAADPGDGSFWMINGTTDSVVSSFSMQDTSAIAVDPTSHDIFVGNASTGLQTGSINVVSDAGNNLSIIMTIPVPFVPGNLAVDPAAHLLFVTPGGNVPSGSPNFVAIDEETHQTAYSITLGQGPNVMAVASPSRLFISDPGQDRLYEVNDLTGEVLLNSTGDQSGSVSFGPEITSMLYGPTMGKLYITERGITDLIVLDVNNNTSSTTSSSSSSLSSSSSSSGSVAATTTISSSISTGAQTGLSSGYLYLLIPILLLVVIAIAMPMSRGRRSTVAMVYDAKRTSLSSLRTASQSSN